MTRKEVCRRYYLKHLDEIKRKSRLVRATPEYQEKIKEYYKMRRNSGKDQAYKLIWTNKNKEKLRLYKRRWRKTQSGFLSTKRSAERQLVINPIKILARDRVAKAVKRGKLFKGLCQMCRSRNVEAHHPDYHKPLEVQWYCRACHIKHENDSYRTD